ncbi:unnamed protein product [Rhizoctonia solani]|uniref:ACB domain-containing protein n=1 Tax=Rhizoctonia solani TaxID=456999 RepID=A0A8H2XGV9_9AGAM|nr:unnamed protein product [Rhizoctonia solani]
MDKLLYYATYEFRVIGAFSSRVTLIANYQRRQVASIMSQAKFDKAVAIVQSLPKDGPVKPTQDDQLKTLTPYPIGTIGDVNTTRPGMLDFTGKAKWDAWNSIKGKSQEDAKKEYVESLLEILGKSESEDAKKWIAEIENA